MTKEESSHPVMFEALEKITKENMKEDIITEARLDWFTDAELPEDQQALYMGPEACLGIPFTAQVWLPDDTTVTVKVTGVIDGQDGVERPGTDCGFQVEYMDHELMLPVDDFVNELANPDDVDGEWLSSPAAVPAKVFAIVRDFYDNAIFTEGNIFFSIWDDVRYRVCNVGQKKEMKKCRVAVKKDYMNNPPAIKKIRSFPKMSSDDRLNCVVLSYPLYLMPLALHTYLSSVAKFPLDLKLKYGGGVVKATGIVPYKANKLFQESRGIYVTVELPQSEAPPSKKRKNSSTRVVALSVHGVEACESTPDPVRRFLEDIAGLMEGEDGMCVLKSRFVSIRVFPVLFGRDSEISEDYGNSVRPHSSTSCRKLSVLQRRPAEDNGDQGGSRSGRQENITEAREDWFTDVELPEDQQALYTGMEECLKFPFTAQVWLPDDSTVTVKVTGIIDGQDGVERPGTGCGFEVEYMGHELMLPVDDFMNELAHPDDVDAAWLSSPAAVPAKVFAVVRDFYDNAFFTEGNIFGSLWDDVRYDVCDVNQKKEMKKCQQAVNKEFLNNPPAIKKIRSFPKMDSEDRMNCVILPFPLCQMSLALHTYLSTVAKFPLDLKLKNGGGVVKATGIVPYKANNLFQESRGIYVTVDLPTAQSEAPPTKKRKNSSRARVVALSVHGVEACESTPDPVRRFLDDIAELMEEEDGMCVLKSRFQAVHCLLPRNKRKGGRRYKFVKRPELINRDYLKELRAGNY
uniref:Uncharacterized protein n=1 Tax=Branchiostoma floridae TaxID=7739 RepID=C3ZDG3_BRAFL|eukprot:XP_002592758.1 hypothetical protein BRAFLDRAFT_117714 [Branchiostoma floridae]